jgi:hypothetical protein
LIVKRKQFFIATLLIVLLVASCNTLEVGIEDPVTSTPVPPSPTPKLASLSPTSEPPTPTPGPPAHPAAGVIYNDAQGLWGIDANGAPILLLDQPEARLSPDGVQAVYPFASGEGAQDIWLADLATGERRNLTQTPDRHEAEPRWWPGGPEVIVFGSDAEMIMAGSGYPTVVGLDGSGYEILDPEEGGPMALSPASRRIAYGGFDALGKIYRWNIGSEVFDPATYRVSAEKLYQPAWSPDERYLAWEVGGPLTGDGSWQIGVAIFDLLAETAQLFHLYEPIGGMFPHYLTWSPDGEHLAFVTFQEPPATGRMPNLWIIDAQTGDEVYVGAGVDPVWSPDGSRLAFSRTEGDTQGVAVADANSGEILDLDLPTGVRSVTGWIDPRFLQASPSTSIPLEGAPESCAPHGDLRAYFEPEGRYCLLYPAHFRIGDAAESHFVFYGPPLDETIEPVMGMLVIHVEDAPVGLTLDDIIDTDDEVIRSADPSLVTREPMTLGSEPAERVEGVGERSRGRVVFVLRDDVLYKLSFYPVDNRFPQAAPDVDAIWSAVVESFTFL